MRNRRAVINVFCVYPYNNYQARSLVLVVMGSVSVGQSAQYTYCLRDDRLHAGAFPGRVSPNV